MTLWIVNEQILWQCVLLSWKDKGDNLIGSWLSSSYRHLCSALARSPHSVHQTLVLMTVFSYFLFTPFCFLFIRSFALIGSHIYSSSKCLGTLRQNYMMYSWATMWSGGGWKEISLNNLFDLKLQNVDLRSLCSSMARGLAWPRPGTTRSITWCRSTVSTWTLRRSAISFGVFVTALAGRWVSSTLICLLIPNHPSSSLDRHLTALRHRRHHRLRLAWGQQRLRQRGRGQHQGHSERRPPESGGHSGGKRLQREKIFLKTQIYALLSDGGEDAPEHKRMESLLWYNSHCSITSDNKISIFCGNCPNLKGTTETVQRPLTKKSTIFCHIFTLFLLSKVQ